MGRLFRTTIDSDRPAQRGDRPQRSQDAAGADQEAGSGAQDRQTQDGIHHPEFVRLLELQSHRTKSFAPACCVEMRKVIPSYVFRWNDCFAAILSHQQERVLKVISASSDMEKFSNLTSCHADTVCLKRYIPTLSRDCRIGKPSFSSTRLTAVRCTPIRG